MVLKGVMDKNPKKIEIRKYANLSQPWNLAFFENEIFQFFFQSYVPKVPEWKIAHIEWSNKVQNIRKSPKNEGFRGTYLNPPFWEHPVDAQFHLKIHLERPGYIPLAVPRKHIIALKYSSDLFVKIPFYIIFSFSSYLIWCV